MSIEGVDNVDNKTIAKLAIAIATAEKLTERGEVIGPLTRKVLETLDTMDKLPHFEDYTERSAKTP